MNSKCAPNPAGKTVRVFTVALSVLMATAVSSAADEVDMEARRAEAVQRLEEISDRLQLTEDQRAEIAPILKQEAADLLAIRDGNGNRRSKARGLKRVADKANADIRALLAPEQQKEYDLIVAERRERLRQLIKERRAAQ